MRFVYSLIRYVPDPIRGEFVNVGAIAGSDESSEWAIRQVENSTRARKLDDRGSLSAVWSLIDRLGAEVDAHEEAINMPTLEEPRVRLSEEWLADLQSRHKNVVQLSVPLPMIAESASGALDRVFAELIVDPARRPGSENKHPALAAARRAYREVGLQKNQNFFESVVLAAGHHRQRLDFAVANGRVVQVAEAWSFQVTNQEKLAEHIKSWGWTMNALQERGGVIHVADKELEVPGDVDIAVVYVPPVEETAGLEDARGVFERLKARQLEVGHAEELGEVAASLLSAEADQPLRG